MASDIRRKLKTRRDDEKALQGLATLQLSPSSRASACSKQLRRLADLLRQELDLLKQIRYKQKNQHRAAGWWRDVTGSQRLVARFLGEFDEHLGPILLLLVPAGAGLATAAESVDRLRKTFPHGTRYPSELTLRLPCTEQSPTLKRPPFRA